MRTRPVIAATAALGLALTLGVAGTAGATEAPGRSDRAQATTAGAGEARQALDAARDVLSGRSPGDTSGREATMVLRDLFARQGELAGADRAAAEAILARPTAPGGDGLVAYSVAEAAPVCGPNVCVHYVPTSLDAPDLTDTSPTNAVPDYVDRVLEAMEQVHTTYVAAGYRAPKPDGTAGGDTKTDVYLADIGGQGLYGYCTSDEEVVQDRYDYWAYCVLDDDYSAAEFPTNTPLENMQVTAAHEYFHAVQFAYDAFEDAWFMEATATWAEDEVYDGVDDNLNYLDTGQLGTPSAGNEAAGPQVPLDGAFGMNVYGNWIFFRYLTERFPAESGGMPSLVLQMWRNADSTGGVAADQYSLQAVRNAVQQVGPDFGKVYADFADANRRPRSVYDEGAANAYPAAPVWGRATLTAKRPRAIGTVQLSHLTSATALIKPGRGIRGKGWKLRVKLDMASRSSGSRAVVTTYLKNGRTSTKHLSLNAKGVGAKAVPFDGRKVRQVEVTMVNASTRTTCWQDEESPYSCLGIPTDDGLNQEITVVAAR
jgi:hypothetical protein